MTQRQQFIIHLPSTTDELVNQLNMIFCLLTTRLDQMEGLKESAALYSDLDMNQHQIKDMADGTADSDAATVGQVTDAVDESGLDHALFDNLNSTDYYHLTEAEYTDMTDGGETILHTHDHGLLGGLTGDDHSQYLLLAGRGGQTVEDDVMISYSSSTGIPTNHNISGAGIMSLTVRNRDTSAVYAGIGFQARFADQARALLGFEYKSANVGEIFVRIRTGSLTSSEVLRLKTTGLELPGLISYKGLYEAVTSTDTTPYATVATDKNIYVDATAAAKTVNLPAATGSGRVLTIKKIAGVVANTVTLQANGAELIDGANTQVIVNQYDSLTIQDAAAGVWYIN